MKVLLIIPPFSQINTPYPSVMNLSAFLQSKGYEAETFDLSIEVILKLFSEPGLTGLFNEVNTENIKSEFSQRIYSLMGKYISVIDFVIEFLQGKNQNMALRLVQEGFLPQGDSFSNFENESFAFGNSGLVDKAVYYCSLLIEDLTKFIKETVSPYFGLSRYAEKIAFSIPEFDPIEKYIKGDRNFIEKIIEEEIEYKIKSYQPELVGFTIPFPGNLLGSVISANHIKKINKKINIVFGGGYVNTELRSITDPGIFNYTDFITFDDGELPLLKILKNVEGNLPIDSLIRTAICRDKTVSIINPDSKENINFSDLPAPSIKGLNPEKYVSMTEILNPMLKLWTDGYHNKIAVAHGCYWKKCTFCDVTLDYIGNYAPAKTKITVDRIEKMMKDSGRNMFHFTDEAAPPSVLKEIAIEIIRRKLIISWWGNIRFEESFSGDLCRLLAKSGCVAVSGGLEVADDRLLKLINKGLTTAQTARVCKNFRKAGILVHTYLMYGFPTETDQETIDSLEMVRQLFELDLINSAFWHRFALTTHSLVAQNPDYFKVKIVDPTVKPFANNELVYKDLTGSDPGKFGAGLHKAIYNYMHGNLLDCDVKEWFDFKTPAVSVKPDYILKSLKNSSNKIKPTSQCIWTGSVPQIDLKKVNSKKMKIHSEDLIGEWNVNTQIGEWLIKMADLSIISKSNNRIKYSDWVENFPGGEKAFNEFSRKKVWKEIRENFLIIV